jgi:hypothetical protein
MADARWLSAEQAAAYVSRRVDELPRLVRRGLLPEPSYHFGPRSPRWDREALDALFAPAAASPGDEKLKREARDALRKRLQGRKANAGGRHSQRIFISSHP